jgi:hypothetical protein
MALQFLIDLLSGSLVLVDAPASGGPSIPATAIQFIDSTYFECIDGTYLEFIT